ncbi:MAG TPA: hypothetical protein VJ385_15015 [Fibrobacteria bacterium]|nr:hypothetical protein [Fibrobacteria bacterium]
MTINNGDEFVVFTKLQGIPIQAALEDGSCEKVFTTNEALEDVRIASIIEKSSKNLEETLKIASREAPKLGFLFAYYLWMRGSGSAMKNPSTFERYVHFLESPGLSYATRYTLLSLMHHPVSANPDLQSSYTNRISLAMFRILSLQNEDRIKDILVDTYLPILLGMQGDHQVKSPADIFKGHPAEKSRAEEFLAAYKGPKDVKPLLEWIRKP